MLWVVAFMVLVMWKGGMGLLVDAGTFAWSFSRGNLGWPAILPSHFLW